MKCPVCKKRIADKDKQKHMNMHVKEAGKKCPLCGETVEDLEEHGKLKHYCTLCGQHVGDLTEHNKKEHEIIQ
jgi:formamidopyrimidine-DNA glycosylase